MMSSPSYNHYRQLSFLDDDAAIVVGENSTGFVVAHVVLTVASFVAMIQGIYETRRKHYLYDRQSLRYFFPWAAFCQMCENLVLAIEISGGNISEPIMDIIYILESTAAPCLLLSTFDVTYSIHKTRHIPFCGVYDGQSTNNTHHPGCIKALKIAMRILALILLAISIITNFNIIHPSSPFAGRVGWYWLITQPWTEGHVHVLLELLPMAVTALMNVYFSIALWRYGTSYSMEVHASPLNPWFTPFFGNMAMIVGQCFGPKWFPLLSNLGTFVFVESILLLFMEVNRDMETAKELTVFLEDIFGTKNQQNTGVKNKQNDVGDKGKTNSKRQKPGASEVEMTKNPKQKSNNMNLEHSC